MNNNLRGFTMTEQEVLEKYKDKRQKCEVWTRVMGYYRPVSGYNKGKQSEFKERVWFTEEMACPCTRESEQVAA